MKPAFKIVPTKGFKNVPMEVLEKILNEKSEEIYALAIEMTKDKIINGKDYVTDEVIEQAVLQMLNKKDS